MAVSVTMLQTRRGEDGNLWTTGSIYSASDAFAQLLVSSNMATGVLPKPDQTGLTEADKVAIKGVVSGAGIPFDTLTAPLQHVNITGAISTTAALTATATGTYTKARVAWNNNGASGSAKLNIAVNSDNDVHGLMVGQNAKRRDYQMTMGDGALLVCGVPITRLTFSSDGAITSGTHSLQVTFGN